MRMHVMILAATLVVAFEQVGAQTPAYEPSARLTQVLPPEVAARVIARIAEAQAQALPVQALEHRVLELAAKGATPAQIERRVDGLATAMGRASEALEGARGAKPSADEITAGGDAMMRGVEGRALSAIASSTPSGRSLNVPFQALSALVARNIPVSEAVARVKAMMEARASDSELLDDVGNTAPRAFGGRPAMTGPGLAATLRPVNPGPPASLPANPGSEGRRPPVAGPPTP